MELSFTAKAQVYCHGLGFLVPQRGEQDGDLDIDPDHSSATINYRLIFNTNRSGIEWISRVVEDIWLQLRVIDYSEDDFEQFHSLWWSELEKQGWTLDTGNLKFREDGAFYIEGINLDFQRRTINFEAGVVHQAYY